MKNLMTKICLILGLIWIGSLSNCATWHAPNVTFHGVLPQPTERKKHSIDLLEKAIKRAKHQNTYKVWQLTFPVQARLKDSILLKPLCRSELQELELVQGLYILGMGIPTDQKMEIEFGHTKKMTGGSTLINLNKDNEQKEKIQRN